MASNNQNDNSMSTRKAGQMGGQQTSATHGKQFYEDIGHKGGEKGGHRVRELIDKGKEAEGSS